MVPGQVMIREEHVVFPGFAAALIPSCACFALGRSVGTEVVLVVLLPPQLQVLTLSATPPKHSSSEFLHLGQNLKQHQTGFLSHVDHI